MSLGSHIGVQVFDESVVLSSNYSSRKITADIVAKEVNDAGHEVIYLNALVHAPGDTFVDYIASGCVSTILMSVTPYVADAEKPNMA